MKINEIKNSTVDYDLREIAYWTSKGIEIEGKTYPIENFSIKDNGLFATIVLDNGQFSDHLIANTSVIGDEEFSNLTQNINLNKIDLESLRSIVNNQSETISTKADKTDLDNLQTTVTSQGDAIPTKADKSEIIEARKGETSLNARLTKNEQEVTAQLAEKAKQTDLEIEKARVDNLLVQPSTDNAETADIRVGADSVTYDSAGKAVRTQFGKVNGDLANRFVAYDFTTSISSIEVTDFCNEGNEPSTFTASVRLIPYYAAKPFVYLKTYTDVQVNVDLSSFATFTLPKFGALVYDINAKTVSIIDTTATKSKNYVVLLALYPESSRHDLRFTGLLANKVNSHRMLSLSSNDISITKSGSYTTIITFNQATTIKVYSNTVSYAYATITAGTSFTLVTNQTLALIIDANSLAVIDIGKKYANTSGYIELLTQGTNQTITGILLQSMIADAFYEAKGRYDYNVTVTNPFYGKNTNGSVITTAIDDLQYKGIYVKFDSLIIRYRDVVITKTWADLKTDLGTTYIAGDYTLDCMLLSVYSYGYQTLYYNLDTNKFVVLSSNQAVTFNNIILAHCKDSIGHGVICERYNDLLVTNKSPYITEINASYRDVIRKKEAELLDAGNNFTFAFCTDLHYYMTENKGGYINATNAVVNDIDKYIGLDCIVNGGDNILYGTKFKQYGLTALSKTFDTINTDKLVLAVGNHDFNSVSDNGVTTNAKGWIITDKELETVFFRKVKTTARPNGKLYYYRDFDDKNVRVIVLNTMDIPIQFNGTTDDAPLVYDPVNVHGMSQEQFNWLIDSALNLNDKSTPSNWKVIVVMHVGAYLESEGFLGNTPTFANRELIKGVLSAFTNKTTYTGSYTDNTFNGIFTSSVNANMTNRAGKLVAVLSGHAHQDGYTKADGFNAIQTTRSYPFSDGRASRTVDEFSVDCIILDDVNQKVKLKRFGYGVDREYSY